MEYPSNLTHISDDNSYIGDSLQLFSVSDEFLNEFCSSGKKTEIFRSFGDDLPDKISAMAIRAFLEEDYWIGLKSIRYSSNIELVDTAEACRLTETLSGEDTPPCIGLGSNTSVGFSQESILISSQNFLNQDEDIPMKSWEDFLVASFGYMLHIARRINGSDNPLFLGQHKKQYIIGGDLLVT